MVTEIGHFSIDDSDPTRHKPADGWTKVSQAKKIESILHTANGFVTEPTGTAKAWLDTATKYMAEGTLDGILKGPDTPMPTFKLPAVSSYPEEAKYLAEKYSKNPKSVQFTPAELSSPHATYNMLAKAHSTPGEMPALVSEFVFTYLDFFFSRGAGGPTDWSHTKNIRASFFSGFEGHGQCGARIPSYVAGLSHITGAPFVRCALPHNHHGNTHFSYLPSEHYWYKFHDASVAPGHRVKKCAAHGFVQRAGESVSVFCGLDMQHKGEHVSNVTVDDKEWPYQTFTANHAPVQFADNKEDFGLPKQTMKMVEMADVVVGTHGGKFSLGKVKFNYEMEQDYHDVDQGNVFSAVTGPTKYTMEITDAAGPLLAFMTEEVQKSNPWNFISWSSNGDEVSPSQAKPKKTKQPEPEPEKPKTDKLDFTPTVKEFQDKESFAQAQELKNQAQGIINNAERMPLGAFLFAQKVLAHFGDS